MNRLHLLNAKDEPLDVSKLPETGKERKTRATRACDSCRKKKVKCYFTPGNSCTNCVSYGVTCEFNDSSKKRGPPKGYIDALEKRIRQIESTLSALPSNILDVHPSPTLNDGTTDNCKVPIHKKTAAGGQSDNVQYLGDLSSFQFLSHKIKMDGNASIWKGQKLRKFGKQVVLVDDGLTQLENATGMYQPQPKIKTLFPGKDIHNWIYSVSGLDCHTSDRLLKIYFANVHPVLPVVNKANFLKQYRDQCDSYPSPDLLNAMFGAAARFVECESQYRDHNRYQPPDMVWDVPLGWSDHFFEQSQTFITQSSALATLSKVQSIILIHNHSGNLDSKSSACWLLGGLAVRLAQGLGLYRDCEEWDIPKSEKETRKRVWWALYITDRFHSATLGRPISIRDEDTDASYPDASATWKEVMDEPDDDDDSNEPRFPSATHKPQNASEEVEIYQLFIQLVKLSEILGRILQGLYTPKAQRLSHEQGSDTIVTRLDLELTEWRFGFPKALQQTKFDDFNENTGYLSPVIATILICYYGLLVLLHRPFIEHVGTGKSKTRPSYSSYRIGSSAATQGIRIASHMEPRDILMFPYAFSLYPVLQCCLIHIYNTKNPDSRTASRAKVDLTIGLALINRLKKMSHNAHKLHFLLETIMENNNIILDSGLDMDDLPRKGATKNTASLISDGGHVIPEIGGQRQSSSILGQCNQQSVSTPPLASQSSTVPLLFQQSFDMSSLADIPVIPFTPSPSSVAEAFSLKQFGFDLPDDSRQPDFTMLDVSTLSMMDSPHILDHHPQSNQQTARQQTGHMMNQLPASNILPFNQNYHHHKRLSSQPSSISFAHQPLPISNNASSPSVFPRQQSSAIPISSLSENDHDANTVFRYNPNNPFFGVPSSMDFSDIAWNHSNMFK